MNKTELRIGNLVNITDNEGGEDRVMAIQKDECICSEYGAVDWLYVNGIPLTPEWLFKNTVVACDGKDSEWYELSGNGWLKIKPLEGSFFFFVGKQEVAEVTTIHQLQNLYFALTGKELKLKP